MEDLVNNTDMGKCLENTIDALKCLATKSHLNEEDEKAVKGLCTNVVLKKLG